MDLAFGYFYREDQRHCGVLVKRIRQVTKLKRSDIILALVIHHSNRDDFLGPLGRDEKSSGLLWRATPVVHAEEPSDVPSTE